MIQKDKIIKKEMAKEELFKSLHLKKDDLIKKMIKYIESQVGDKKAEKNLTNLLEVFR